MRMVLLGAPGVGKGTVGDMLAEKFGIPKISTGDIFRKAIAEKTPLGRKVNELTGKGELVPDDITVAIVKERIAKEDCKNGFIMDGFPRTIHQAEELDKLLKGMNLRLDAVVNIFLPKEEIIRRISLRRTCGNCSMIYNLNFSPPKKDGVCDKCGGLLYQRDDEKEETVLNRLSIYEKQTAPLIKYYEGRSRLINVTGETSKEIFERLIEIL
ncbi:adenylate kinase [Candidatus Micrarchaeota archaeon]|nr:adenylate kinase [Candidatus Micrarchaeota archaeon]